MEFDPTIAVDPNDSGDHGTMQKFWTVCEVH